MLNNLLYNTIYYWRVSAVNNAGKSAWSDVQNFTTAPKNQLSRPVLISPADKSSGINPNPLLTWNSVSNAVTYRLQISDSSNFNSLLLDTNNLTSTSFEFYGLSNNTNTSGVHYPKMAIQPAIGRILACF